MSEEEKKVQITVEVKERANWIGAPEFFNLNQACLILTQAFGLRTYLVGSALERRDFRDVDLRCILDDKEYERLFGTVTPQYNALWSLMCASISEYLANRTNLKIDFQFQKQTEANSEFGSHSGKRRSAVGMFLHLGDGEK